MEHSQDCEVKVKERIAELNPQIQHVCAQFVNVKRLIAAGDNGSELALKEVQLANQIMALECLKEQYLNHLLEHKVDSLEARVLELEMNVEDRVRQAVQNYFKVTLDSEESE